MEDDLDILKIEDDLNGPRDIKDQMFLQRLSEMTK
jgi:hypothetical protein